MRVLFLELDTENEWAVASLGPGFLAAWLRHHGHEAALLRIAADQPLDAIAAEIRGQAPGLIGVSMTTRQWLRAREVLSALRRVSNVPVIAGGLHATFSPEDVLRHDGIDAVCLGEGEAALLDLVNALQSGQPPTDIPNIWVKHNARPKLRNPIEPFDAIPFLAGDMLDKLQALRNPGPLNYVIFLDDTFTIHPPWVRDFGKVYAREFAVPFSLN